MQWIQIKDIQGAKLFTQRLETSTVSFAVYAASYFNSTTIKNKGFIKAELILNAVYPVVSCETS